MSTENYNGPAEAMVAALLANAKAKGLVSQAACDAKPYDHGTVSAAVGEQTAAIEAYSIARKVLDTWKAPAA